MEILTAAFPPELKKGQCAAGQKKALLRLRAHFKKF